MPQIFPCIFCQTKASKECFYKIKVYGSETSALQPTLNKRMHMARNMQQVGDVAMLLPMPHTTYD